MWSQGGGGGGEEEMASCAAPTPLNIFIWGKSKPRNVTVTSLAPTEPSLVHTHTCTSPPCSGLHGEEAGRASQ